MKITIDKDVVPPSDEEREEISLHSKNAEDDKEEFKRQILNCKEVVIPQFVLDETEKRGLTADDLVAMILKAAGASQ